jgi:lysyl hydroxylase/galactosyltransferase/glucosyltransferase/procollagen-lysine,2-oxoglutarate 5-dioxygenase
MTKYHIFVINLKRCVEKRKKMENRLSGLNFTIVDACDGKNLSNSELEKINAGILKEWKDPHSGRNITWGEVGCAVSHHKIYEHCVKNNIENAVIFEDDAEVPSNLNDKLENTFDSLKKLIWDFCYIARKPMEPKKDMEIIPNMIRPAYSYWLCGYIINLEGMKKIIQSNFIKKIIPMDEIIPLLGNISPLTEYKNYFDNKNPLNIYSVKDLYIKPENNAFLYSDTENTKEVENYSDDLLVLATGTDMTDGLKRFINSCKVYGLQYKIMGLGDNWEGGNMSRFPGGGQKVNLLIKTIENMEDDKIILVTDSYDVIMSANSKEILDKYKKFSKKLVFATESDCWPDEDKADNFPKILNKKNIYLNSGGFIGDVKTIKEFIKNIPNDADDQRWYQNMFLSESGKKYMELDYNCEIFQCLNDAEDELQIHFSKSRVYNKVNDTYPCQIHGNGPITRKTFLNRFESYLMKNWTDIWGYNKKNLMDIDNLKKMKELTIYIQIVDTTNKPHLITQLKDIIKDNITELKKYVSNIIVTKQIDNVTRNFGIEEAYKLRKDYYWLIDTTYVITNKNTLLNLILHDKGIISPLIKKNNHLWSNFWGQIDIYGWYKNSIDYKDIVERIKTGCWNVPHIAGNILIKGDYLNKVIGFYTNNSNNHNFNIDMMFAYNCRANNIFMYLDNTEKYGYIDEGIKDVIPEIALHKELYLFESGKELWAKKYLHPDFLNAIDNWENLPVEESCKWAFEFPFVNDVFCDQLVDEVNNINEWSPGGKDEIADKRLNNIENVPTVDIHMKQIGFRKQWESIINTYIAPLVSHLYSPFKTTGLNIAFVVKYEMGNQEHLNPHHDSSAYSINITLNTPNVDFTGGGTRFINQDVSIQGKKGWATIHPGRLTHYHEGLPITKGKRLIFVSFVN